MLIDGKIHEAADRLLETVSPSQYQPHKLWSWYSIQHAFYEGVRWERERQENKLQPLFFLAGFMTAFAIMALVFICVK